MSAVTLVHRLTSMCLPLGAFWPLGLTRCCRRGSSLLQTSLQVDGTVMLAEGCHQGSLCYGHSVTRLQRLRPMRLPLQRRPSAAMRGWPCTLFAFCLPRHVVHAAHGDLDAHIAHAAQVASMVPMQPLPVHKSVQIHCKTNTVSPP